MLKKNSFKHVRKMVAGFAVLLVLLQGPLFIRANAQKPVTPEPDNVIEGYTFNPRAANEVNEFLGKTAEGNRFLEGMSSRGVSPDKVNYISLSGDSTDPNNDLTILANRLNESEGAKVASVDMLIGAYEGTDGKLDGEVLLVANLAGGGQSLLSGFQANDDNLNGKGTPVGYAGDYFAGFKQGRAISIVICWLECFWVQQIIVQLRCVLVSILHCFRVGPFIICFRTWVLDCKLIFIVRTFLVCYVKCITIIIFGAIPNSPKLDDSLPVKAVLNPRQWDSDRNQNKQPILPRRHLARSALAG